MVPLVFGGGRPESIQSSGYLTNTGVDELASVIIKYPGMLCCIESLCYKLDSLVEQLSISFNFSASKTTLTKLILCLFGHHNR